ncbi:putative transcription factor NOZZLE family [Lupinus albus]|uniref:Putative transcription factor NOZZLE family n=1 Tax=Lupinus albus TaxID=3870 RepID=A0A6A4NCS4_LUPAL|nr:putative transcription factor NOZZLE family [Lupinus albus]
MATSLLFKALSDQNSNHDGDQNMKMKPLCEDTKGHEVGRSSGRGRKTQGKGPKKQPQRGLGVEQLERLRMQESLMKMNETCSGFPVIPNFPDHHHHHHHHLPVFPSFTSVQDPFNSSTSSSVPVRYGAPNHVQGVIQCSPQQVLNGNSIGVWDQNGPFIGNNRVGVSSGICGVGFVVPNQLNRVSSYGFGVPTLSPNLVGSPLETSKELSSMPNVHFAEPQCFDVCLNKKSRFNEVSVKGSYARRDMTFEIWPNCNSPEFLGLIPQASAPNLVEETSNFYNKHDRNDVASATNIDESVEIVAVHRKGNSRVFMEYEFFPGKDDLGTTSKVLELATNIGAAEASPITTAPYGDSASNVDLSLKLSN